jgi:hypothetical protein
MQDAVHSQAREHPANARSHVDSTQAAFSLVFFLKVAKKRPDEGSLAVFLCGLPIAYFSTYKPTTKIMY